MLNRTSLKKSWSIYKSLLSLFCWLHSLYSCLRICLHAQKSCNCLIKHRVNILNARHGLRPILRTQGTTFTQYTRLLIFKNTCKNAIRMVRPVLIKHRALWEVLAKFLLAVVTFPVSLPLYAAGFFSTKTKSEQLLDKLQEAMDNPDSQKQKAWFSRWMPFIAFDHLIFVTTRFWYAPFY